MEIIKIIVSIFFSLLIGFGIYISFIYPLKTIPEEIKELRKSVDKLIVILTTGKK